MSINSCLNKIFSGENRFADFLNSKLFIWLNACIALIFWVSGEILGGLIAFCALSFLVLVFCKDAKPVVTSLVFFFFVFSDGTLTIEGREGWIAVLCLPIVGFIYNILRFGTEGFALKGFSFSVLPVTLAWFLQGILREGRELVPALLCVGIALVYTLIYFFILATSRASGRDCLEYFAHVLFVLGILIMAQIAVYYIRINDFAFKDDYIKLGWGTRNPVSAMLALIMPISFYYATGKRKFDFLFIFLGFIQYTLILLLQSRGVALFATAALPCLMIYTVVKGKRIPLGIINAVVVVSALTLIFASDKVFDALFRRLAESGLNSNGRIDLYNEGIDVFLRNPIFGAGFDYESPLYQEMIPHSTGPSYFHSTFLQIFASLGIVGFLAYLYFYYWRYRIALTNLDGLKFAFLVGMLVFECYGFIDNVFFQPQGYFILLVISLFTEKELSLRQTSPNIYKLFRLRRI